MLVLFASSFVVGPALTYWWFCCCSVAEKSEFYTQMRQMRLAMEESAAAFTSIIEAQRGVRRKLNRDLVKAQEMIKKLEEIKCGLVKHRTLLMYHGSVR